jgi:hypothetical protein
VRIDAAKLTELVSIWTIFSALGSLWIHDSLCASTMEMWPNGYLADFP